MRSALQAIVISVALVTGACSESSYLRSFGLRRSVCDLSYPGVICTQPGSGSGGIGSLAGGFGGSGGTAELTLSTSEIFGLATNGGQSFDLVAFQSRLAASIKRDLEHSGYEVTDSASDSGNWYWRCSRADLSEENAARLKELSEIYGRSVGS